MVRCEGCGKAIEKVPDWMQAIKVSFVCNNCPNRQTKNIAFVNLDLGVHASQKLDDAPVEEAEAEADEAAD